MQNIALKVGIALRAQTELTETSEGNGALFAYFQIKKVTSLNNIYPIHLLLLLKTGDWHGTEKLTIFTKVMKSKVSKLLFTIGK